MAKARPLASVAKARTSLSAPPAVALAFGVLLALAACAGARGGTVQAPVVLAVAPLAGLPEAGIATSAAPSGGRCSVRLVAGKLEKSAPGCYIDEHIQGEPGVLDYPCNGDGAVEAKFGESRYSGQMTGGEVELELVTEIDWEDGCRWETTATIGGKVGGAASGEPLEWRYRDRVVAGTSCSGACTARTSLAVVSTDADADEDEPDEDEESD